MPNTYMVLPNTYMVLCLSFNDIQIYFHW